MLEARKTSIAILVAAFVCGAGTLVRSWPLLTDDLAAVALVPIEVPAWFAGGQEWDQRYAIWAVARNSEVLTTRPWALFDAPQCFPARNSLARGHGVVTLGVLAAPLRMLTTDPLVLHNLVFLSTIFAAGLAMAWVATTWTGSVTAGVLAAAIYAFHPAKLGFSEHFYLTDTIWFVLALGLLARLGARPSWLAALALSVVVCLQIGAGVYPAYGAAIAAVPITTALFFQGKLARASLPKLAAVAVVAAAATLVLHAPYLSLRESGVYSDRAQHFLFPSEFLPAGSLFPGILSLLLVSAALAWPREGRGARPSRGLRWCLLGSALMLAWIATGGHLFSWHLITAADFWSVDPKNSLPWGDPTPLFSWIQDRLPGLRIGRAPRYAYGPGHACLSLLVACGAADLERRFHGGGRRVALAAMLCAALAAAVGLGVVPASPYKAVHQRPPEAQLEFFQALAADGNRGPLLELPLVANLEWWARASSSLLVTAYHHRATSECFSSFHDTHLTPELKLAAERVPSPDAIETIRAAGFTTILVHLGSAAGAGKLLADRLAQAAGTRDAPLKLARTSDSLVAFELIEQPAARSAPGAGP